MRPYRDPRPLYASANRTSFAAVLVVLRRHVAAGVIALFICASAWLLSIAAGFHAVARESGTMQIAGVDAPVTIVRDGRGIPHIRARTLHDLFFAQGFAEASDRLFQMDVTRRYAYGTLAEVFGSRVLSMDENTRALDIHGVVLRQWRALDAQSRAALTAFADGVNAARQRQPLPLEFRLLLYEPQRWTPQDSLAVSMIAMFELADAWQDIEARDGAWRSLSRACYDALYPLSDPRYDVRADGTPYARDVKLPACDSALYAMRAPHAHIGSNAWAAGSLRTKSGHALLANDPHVDLTIPGIWYAIDLRAPGLHAAGAVVPGLPGVTLGHNERIAWGVTNAQVATTVLFRCRTTCGLRPVTEHFNVRFAPAAERTYYRDARLYSVPDTARRGETAAWWPPYAEVRSPLATDLRIERAGSITAAMRILAQYRGSPENFVIASAGGSVAYHLAGDIPQDPAWGRYVQPERELQRGLHKIAFSDLPARSASRSGIVVSANNKMYGAQYPYRLSAVFEPPYRAYRIASLLRSRASYDGAFFEHMQLDTHSPIDAEIARALARIAPVPQLAAWSGDFAPRSRAASLEYGARTYLQSEGHPLEALLADFRSRDAAQSASAADMHYALTASGANARAWSEVGRVDVDHPLSQLWYGWLRGVSLPGNGNEFTIHLQEQGFAQGFRAVWEAGNWDAGGIVLPSGESGEPASPHYDDLASTWIAGKMVPLPFSDAAVKRASVARLTLAP